MTGPVLLDSVRIEHNGLTLRSPRDEDIDPLMAVYDDSFNLAPGARPVTEPATARNRILDERIVGKRHPTDRSEWHMELIVESGPNTVIGWATLAPAADSYQIVETTSWVSLPQRGLGHSRTIRQGVLLVAFDGLGAQLAVSRAQPDSFSNHTSERLGYQRQPRPGDHGYQTWYLSKQSWEASRPSGIELDGYECFRDWLRED